MKDFTLLATRIAFEAHTGQVDKAGAPYFLHPLAVAQKVAEQGGDDYAVSAALLHDVVEDTQLTFSDLEKKGIPLQVIDALHYLTHRAEVPYMDYVRCVKENAIARMVKIADLEHNMDLSRLAEVTAKDIARLEKYKVAYDYLNSNEGEI